MLSAKYYLHASQAFSKAQLLSPKRATHKEGETSSEEQDVTTTCCPLYGGAITCDIPSTWRDVSQIRQVPDHQEVYQEFSPDIAASGTGPCIVFEILQREECVRNEDASRFFLNDLADANSAPTEEEGGRLLLKSCFYVMAGKTLNSSDNESTTSSDSWMHLPHFQKLDNCTVCLCLGRQLVLGKGLREGDPRVESCTEWVTIEMCILRLKNLQTDLVISLTSPVIDIKEDCKAKASVGSAVNNDRTDKVKNNIIRKKIPKLKAAPNYSAIFRRIVSSFEVQDWSLFV